MKKKQYDETPSYMAMNVLNLIFHVNPFVSPWLIFQYIVIFEGSIVDWLKAFSTWIRCAIGNV